MEVTDLGLKTCDILTKYSPSILDDKLTRTFEEELEEIRHDKKTQEDVLKEARDILTNLLTDFKEKELEIGEALKQAHYDSRNAAATMGKCPNCKDGILKLRKGKYGEFIGCDAYPKCKTIFSIPRNAIIKSSKKECEKCGFPMIQVIKAKKRPQEVCLNPECSSRQTEEEKNADEGEKVYPEEGMQCPVCKKGSMVLRKSFYGTFLGCNNYPKCMTMMKIVDGKVNTTPITKKASPKKVPVKKKTTKRKTTKKKTTKKKTTKKTAN